MPKELRVCRWCHGSFVCQAAPSIIALDRGHYCSRQCSMRSTLTGRPSRNWRGGRTKTASGHIAVYTPTHPRARRGGRVLEHRLVMEGVLGRRLERHEIVHHINGDPTDNDPENLMLMTQSEHLSLHNVQRNETKRAELKVLEWLWYLEG